MVRGVKKIKEQYHIMDPQNALGILERKPKES